MKNKHYRDISLGKSNVELLLTFIRLNNESFAKICFCYWQKVACVNVHVLMHACLEAVQMI